MLYICPIVGPASVLAWVGALGVGSLIGIAASLWVTARQQHTNWINDNKKSEYRELLGALYETLTVVLENRPSLTEVKWEPINDVANKLARAFEDRIFTDEPLRKVGTLQDWYGIKRVIYYEPELQNETPSEFRYTTNNLMQREDKLRKKIVELAKNDIVRFKFFGR